MNIQLRTILGSFGVTCALLAAILLLGTEGANAGGLVSLTDPPVLTVKQRADQLVALAKGGYHIALFSTTPKEKFSFASGTDAALVSTTPKSKFAFASGARVAADPPLCNTICRLVPLPPSLPDLSMTLYARPSTLNGTQPISVVVTVFELNKVAATGPVSVKISKDMLLSLSFDPMATSVGGKTVKNSAWSFSGPAGGYYTLTSNELLGAKGVLSFGLSGMVTPGATAGSLTVSSLVIASGFSESRLNNNTDADKIEYFPQ